MLVRDRLVLRRGMLSLDLKALAYHYRRFPLFSAPAAMLNSLSGRIPIFLLAAFYGQSTVGLFGLAFGTLALPVGVITGAVGQVFFVRAAEAQREGSLGTLTTTVFRRLVAVSLFPMAATAVAGPDLFAVVFGDPWREAGVYAQWLTPWLFTAAVAAPLTRIFDVTERQRSDLIFSVLLFAVQATALVAAHAAGGPRLAVASVGIAGAVARLLQIGWMLRLAKAPLATALSDLARHVVVAFLLLAPALAGYLAIGSIPMLLGALAGGAVLYALYAIRLERR